MIVTSERAVATRGRDENIVQMVTFPCNENHLREVFQVEDIKDLCLTEHPEAELSILSFNHAIREADARAAKIESSIEAAVSFLQERMIENSEWVSGAETIPLNLQDEIVWKWCMKDIYRHLDRNVSVWSYKGGITVCYARKKANSQ